MALVMESGVIRDRGIMRRDKKDHHNGNTEIRKTKKNKEWTGTMFWKYACTIFFHSKETTNDKKI